MTFFYISYNIIKKLKEKKKMFKVWDRSSTIIDSMLNHIFGVYNGKKFIPVYISEKLFGYKLGNFSLTRKFKQHKTKDKKLVSKKLNK